MDLTKARKLLNGRSNLRVSPNTYLHPCIDGIRLRFYNTEILHFRSNGDIVVTSGGKKTATTKSRLNEYLPDGFSIRQEKGI